MGHEEVPPEKWNATFESIVENYKQAQKKLSELEPDDSRTNDMLRRASKLAEQGKIDEATELIEQAEQLDLKASVEFEERRKTRILNAAKARAVRARLFSSELKYKDAAELFKSAADLVNDAAKDIYLNMQLNAALMFYDHGNEKGDNKSLYDAVGGHLKPASSGRVKTGQPYAS